MARIQNAGVSPLARSQATILQLNIGLYCNQACTHCHVESSPKRTEMMDHATAERCIELLKASTSITTLDITGGAPELNAEFRYLVEAASQLGVEIIDRCNLTVLVEPGQEHLAQFLADHKVCMLIFVTILPQWFSLFTCTVLQPFTSVGGGPYW
jgi:radical SAM/Cys-rich protein